LASGKLIALEEKYKDVIKKREPHPDVGDWWAVYDYGLDSVKAWAKDYHHPYPGEFRGTFRTIQGTFRTIQGTFRTIKGTFRTIQETLRTMQVTFRTIQAHDYGLDSVKSWAKDYIFLTRSLSLL
jgi:hypothetical protein